MTGRPREGLVGRSAYALLRPINNAASVTAASAGPARFERPDLSVCIVQVRRCHGHFVSELVSPTAISDCRVRRCGRQVRGGVR